MPLPCSHFYLGSIKSQLAAPRGLLLGNTTNEVTLKFKSVMKNILLFFWRICENFSEANSPSGNRTHTKRCFPMGNSHLPIGKMASVATPIVFVIFGLYRLISIPFNFSSIVWRKFRHFRNFRWFCNFHCLVEGLPLPHFHFSVTFRRWTGKSL